MYTIEIKDKETGETVEKDESKWIWAFWETDGDTMSRIVTDNITTVELFTHMIIMESSIQEVLNENPEMKRAWEHRDEIIKSIESIDMSGLLQ